MKGRAGEVAHGRAIVSWGRSSRFEFQCRAGCRGNTLVREIRSRWVWLIGGLVVASFVGALEPTGTQHSAQTVSEAILVLQQMLDVPTLSDKPQIRVIGHPLFDQAYNVLKSQGLSDLPALIEQAGDQQRKFEYRRVLLTLMQGWKDPRTISAAVEWATKDPDPRIRMEAIGVLEGVEGPDALAGLAKGLKDPEIPVRAAAIHGLTNHRGEEAKSILLKCLENEENGTVRAYVASALKVYGQEKPVFEALLGKLKMDEYPTVRARAAEALAQVADPRVTEALLEVMRNDDPDFAVAHVSASKILSRIGSEVTREELIQIQQNVHRSLYLKQLINETVIAIDHQGTEDPLILLGLELTFVTSKNSPLVLTQYKNGLLVTDVRTGGRAERGGLRKHDMLVTLNEKLVNGLHEFPVAWKVSQLQIPSALKVGYLRNQKEMSLTLGLDASTVHRVRGPSGRAATLLAEIKRVCSYGQLNRVNPYHDPQYQSLFMEFQMFKSTALSLVITEVSEASRPLRYREALFGVLIAWNDPAAAVMSRSLLRDPDSKIRLLAAELVGVLKDPSSFMELVEAFQNESDPKALALEAQALENFRDERAVSVLLKRLRGEPVALNRAPILLALGGFSARDDVFSELMVVSTHDSDVTNRRWAVIAMERNPARAVPYLHELMLSADSTDERVKVAACKVLGRIGSIESIGMMSTLWKNGGVGPELHKALEKELRSMIRGARSPCNFSEKAGLLLKETPEGLIVAGICPRHVAIRQDVEIGDRITKVEDRGIARFGEWVKVCEAFQPGSLLRIGLVRRSESRTATLLFAKEGD